MDREENKCKRALHGGVFQVSDRWLWWKSDAQGHCWTRLSCTNSAQYHQRRWWWHVLSGKKERVIYLRHSRNPIFQWKEVDKWNVEVLSKKRATIFHLCTSWLANGKASQNFQQKNLHIRKSGKKTSAKPYIVRLPYKPQACWRGHNCIRGRGHQSLLQVRANSESNKSSGRSVRWRCSYQRLKIHVGQGLPQVVPNCFTFTHSLTLYCTKMTNLLLGDKEHDFLLVNSRGNHFNHASYTTCLHFLQNIFQWS